MLSPPVIDITPIRSSSDEAGAAACIEALHSACTEFGFFAVTGHGLDESMDALFEMAHAFGRLPAAEKEAIPRVDAHGYGTNGPVEYIDMDLRGGRPLPDIHGFEKAIRTYQREALEVTAAILRSLAVALELPASFFTDHMTEPQVRMRLFFYRAAPPNHDGSWRVLQRPHTDFGLITLLATDGNPGLEIKPLGGEWTPLVAPYGQLIVNLGDMLARWTNHRYQSTPHRAVVPPHRERLSIPFFVNPNPDAEIASVPSCITPENPLRYEPVKAGDFLASRLAGRNELYVDIDEGPPRFGTG